MCERLLHNLFVKQSLQSPAATTVFDSKKSLTFKELDDYSTKLACYLRQHGAVNNDLVAIVMTSGVDILVAMLGVLKAGCAYIPLDVSYPEERISYILGDSQPVVILSESSLSIRVSNGKAHLIEMDNMKDEIYSQDFKQSVNATTVDDLLAYVIYTSGSTGKPKGVVVSHHALINHMRWMLNRFDFNTSDVFLQKTPVSFDASVWEFYAPILSGGSLCIAPQNAYRDPRLLISLIQKHGVTVLQLVPTLLPEFIKLVDCNNCRSLRKVFISGELLIRKIALELSNKLPQVEIYNLYGPTEATIDASYHRFNRDDKRLHVPIGKPIDNVGMYILNDDLSDIADNEQGILYIGGKCLAEGYLNSELLTREKFLKSPGHIKYPVLYKTDDIVRKDRDGVFEFIGRANEQIKIRGYRIELGEIKHCLLQLALVKSVEVLPKTNSQNIGILIAYIVRTSEHLDKEAVRFHLAKFLPDYMIPSEYVFLKELPLLPNGKTDKNALLNDRNVSKDKISEHKLVPYTEREISLIKIISRVLNSSESDINFDDNFFDIGGTSLSAIQVVNAVNMHFMANLQVADIFRRPVIAQLVELLNEKKHNALDRVRRADIKSSYWLSFAQEMIWFHQQVNPEKSFYNESLSIVFNEKIDLGVLEKSISFLINRHDLLRSRIYLYNGMPYLKIMDNAELQFECLDLSGIKDAEKSARLYQVASKVLSKPFKWDSEPLVRFMVVSLASNSHKLFVFLHHCISDAVSVYSVLYPELEQVYYAFLNQETPGLDDLTHKYTDYISWQRDVTASKTFDLSVKYWQDKLFDLKVVRFPFGRYKDAPSFDGKLNRFLIPCALKESLEKLSKKFCVTLFTSLLAVFALLVYRYTLLKDIAVGSVVSDRNRVEFENIFGNFLNTIILRNKVNGQSAFPQFLDVVKNCIIEAFQHQDVPFSELLRAIKLPRRSNAYLPFQIAFIYQPSPPESEHGWEVNQTEIHSGTAKFDLMFELEERSSGIVGRVEYSTDIFDDYYIEKLINSYLIMLESLVAQPDQIIDEIPLLSRNEQKVLLDKWNGAKTQYDNNCSICSTIQDYVKLNADNIAIINGERTLSYCDMERQANILAQCLVEHGICDAESIAVCCDRSIELIIAILGVLKVGGIYVPIKSDYPGNRISYILSDSKCKLIIIDGVNFEKINNIKSIGVARININKLDFNIPMQPVCNDKITGISPAYMIYTSGSTGKPKGVVQTHRTLNNLIQWQASELSKAPIKRVACFASVGFDVSLQEMFFALGNGYELCIVPEDIKHSFSATVQYIEKNKIDVLFLPTRMLEYLAEAFLKYGADTAYPKYIIVAGEALEITTHTREMFAKYSNTRLINQYGPTETHVVASYQLDENPGNWAEKPPIGKPIANNRFYVLNKAMQLVPVGVVGELYVSGDNLAHGYANNNALTNKRFVSNPFSKSKNELMYQTGDLVKWTPDGMLEFIGRNDEQIKVRGFRVELAEVKAVIMQDPDVIDCEVIVTKKGRASHIAAYLVFAKDKSDSMEAVKSLCVTQLPGYMMPQQFIIKSELPLISNGKLDKQALLAELQDEGRVKPETVSIKPKTELQKRLAELWSKILEYGSPDIGIDDDFFDLGGHSLSVLQLLSHLKDHFNLDLKFCEFARFTTISKLEERIEAFFTGSVTDEEIKDIS